MEEEVRKLVGDVGNRGGEELQQIGPCWSPLGQAFTLSGTKE